MIDGTEYSFPCDVERSVEIQSSGNSGYLIDNTYFNDPLASYVKYSVTLVVPIGQEDEYANLFQLLALPMISHTFTFPYNQGDITFEGRVNVISDKFYAREDDVNVWRHTKFECVANEPLFEASDYN